ncbi:hypothetical protein BC936DRAFT_139180 [Jimgerdemannia flammicorona]|uniref:Uncharacterized protein n=1 Tax=Jimgerdemannia flammicorona TaxID=994334 RepID=A0A433BAH4_9FUNG|nr:hypothetical protein BC936DRAFT_139180 [Jimgerdemannia flammicorona]
MMCFELFTYVSSVIRFLSLLSQNNPHDNNTASSGGKHPTKKPSAVTSASSTSSPAAGRALPPNPGSLSPSGDSSVAPPPSASRPRTRGRRLELIFDDVTHNDMSSDQPPVRDVRWLWIVKEGFSKFAVR